jgi:hypothetical protein
MKLFMKSKASPATTRSPSPAANGSIPVGISTQEWMPVKDVYNGLIHRKDGTLVCAIRVQPKNIKLLSLNEAKRLVKLLAEVLNGIDYSYQIITIPRPVDLDAYIAKLQNLKSIEENPIKNRLLGNYISQAASVAVSGEALDRLFYILIDERPSNKKHQSEAILLQRGTELVSNLMSADLNSHLCSDDELRELLFIFTNLSQAAYERAPKDSLMLPPIFEMRD